MSYSDEEGVNDEYGLADLDLDDGWDPVQARCNESTQQDVSHGWDPVQARCNESTQQGISHGWDSGQARCDKSAQQGVSQQAAQSRHGTAYTSEDSAGQSLLDPQPGVLPAFQLVEGLPNILHG